MVRVTTKHLLIAAALAAAPAAVTAQSAGATASSMRADPGGEQAYTQRYVTTDVNLRAGPGTDHEVLAVLRQGDFVNVGTCADDWCADNCALYRAITPDNQLHEERLLTPSGAPICAN